MSILPLHKINHPRIATRFYYGEKGLCFDLIVEDKLGNQHDVVTFTEYDDYRLAFEDTKLAIQKDSFKLPTRLAKKSA